METGMPVNLAGSMELANVRIDTGKSFVVGEHLNKWLQTPSM
jgi:hypothetical protein